MKKKIIIGVAILSMATSFVGCSTASVSTNDLDTSSLPKLNIEQLTEEFILSNADWREGYTFILVQDDTDDRVMYLDEQLVSYYYDASGNTVTSPIYPYS